jgi:hypothetical protein
MPLDDLQQQVASVVLQAAKQHGFALAGGCALIVHGVVDRRTEDVDLFTDRAGGVEAAVAAVEASLEAAGFQVGREDKTAGLADVFPGMGEGLAEWIITAPGGEQVRLQIAYFDRHHAPVTMDIGPVLDLPDVIAGKVVALASRAAERDYIDTAAALGRGYDVAQLISLAQELDPGLEDQDFAEAGDRLDQMTDRAFARYDLAPPDIALLRQRFANWPRS